MSNQTDSIFIDSPLGILKLEATQKAVMALRFRGDTDPLTVHNHPANPLLKEAKIQLRQYFSGDRHTFNLPVELSGTSFEREVWHQLTDIPFGQSITYKQLAQKLGDVNKVRAVGRANGQNPVPIVVPCHRVMGANNKLTGYSGGVERKRWLLQHEGLLLL